jgi:hypothetical protein
MTAEECSWSKSAWSDRSEAKAASRFRTACRGLTAADDGDGPAASSAAASAAAATIRPGISDRLTISRLYFIRATGSNGRRYGGLRGAIPIRPCWTRHTNRDASAIEVRTADVLVFRAQ